MQFHSKSKILWLTFCDLFKISLVPFRGDYYAEFHNFGRSVQIANFKPC